MQQKHKHTHTPGLTHLNNSPHSSWYAFRAQAKIGAIDRDERKKEKRRKSHRNLPRADDPRPQTASICRKELPRANTHCRRRGSRHRFDLNRWCFYSPPSVSCCSSSVSALCYSGEATKNQSRSRAEMCFQAQPHWAAASAWPLTRPNIFCGTSLKEKQKIFAWF